MSGPRKRSVVIAGHPTSLTLEDEFWDELRRIAKEEGVSVPVLIGRIDSRRDDSSLSSAVRVFVLRHLRKVAGRD